MKLKQFVSQTHNTRTNQKSFCLRKKALKKAGLTVNDLLDIPVLKKSKIEFGENLGGKY